VVEGKTLAPEKGIVRTRSPGTAGMGRLPRKAEQTSTLRLPDLPSADGEGRFGVLGYPEVD